MDGRRINVPDTLQEQINHAWMLGKNHQSDNAFFYFQEAINLNPESVEVCGHWTVCPDKQKMIAGANYQFLKILAIDPIIILEALINLDVISEMKEQIDKTGFFLLKLCA